MARTRLSPDLRRAQLLSVGAELFAERAYDDVRIEDVADRAGVSRGLLYRYFATKRDLFRAMIADASEQILTMTAPDESLPVPERITVALDRYLAHFEANAPAVRAATSGIASGDPEIQAILRDSERRQEDRILGQVVTLGLEADAVLRVSVRGWLHLTRGLTLDWLDNPQVTREELRDICVRALLAIAADAATAIERSTRGDLTT